MKKIIAIRLYFIFIMLYIIQQFQTRYHLYGNEWN